MQQGPYLKPLLKRELVFKEITTYSENLNQFPFFSSWLIFVMFRVFNTKDEYVCAYVQLQHVNMFTLHITITA